jgi:uncharacterized membrane protein
LFWNPEEEHEHCVKPSSIIALARCTASDDQCSRAGGIKQHRNIPQGRLQREFEPKGVWMTKGRMEAFSDGVLAVIITIMVLEIRPPHGTSIIALQPLFAVFFSYVMSFVYVGIYWNNHHHLLHASQHVTGGVLWANLHLLFWLSLTPFATAWMGENHFAPWPVALYGVVLLFAAVAYFLLTKILIAHHGKDSTLAASIGSDRKGGISVVVYVAAVPLSFVQPWIACTCYALVAVMWLIPDPRIEKTIGQESLRSS